MGTSTTPSTRLYFGSFELDPHTGELWKSGQPVKLPPQPTKLLIFLASRRGELVTREEIKESLWDADTFVDFEQGLNFCIKKIRSALGDNPDQPEFIQTLPRRGYRFIASVQSQARNQRRKEEITDKDVSVSHSSRRWRKLLPAVALIVLVILTVSYALHRHFRSVEQQHPKRIMLVNVRTKPSEIEQASSAPTRCRSVIFFPPHRTASSTKTSSSHAGAPFNLFPISVAQTPAHSAMPAKQIKKM